MKTHRFFLTALALLLFTGLYAQQASRNDICSTIPNLTSAQQIKIDKLSTAHQLKMDELRLQYRSESDPLTAKSLKAKMSSEMTSHYQNISTVLTPDQLAWYKRSCNANTNGRYTGRGYGRNNTAMASGTGRGLGRGAGKGRAAGNGRGRCRTMN